MIDWYAVASGCEAIVRFGPADGRTLLIALPPFEEYNRTRTFAVGLMRRLAARGIASALPDLPGMGESLVSGTNARLSDWRSAFAEAARHTDAIAAVAIRGGALIDGDAALAGRWHLSPQAGATLTRELRRIQAAAAREAGTQPVEGGETITVAGHILHRELTDALAAAEPRPARVVRLEGDNQPADRHVAGLPLWRRAEPGDDPALAQILAADIAAWLPTCVA